jgi:hypothetical protein
MKSQSLPGEAEDYYNPGPMPGGMMQFVHHSWTMKTQALSLDDRVGATWADPLYYK